MLQVITQDLNQANCKYQTQVNEILLSTLCEEHLQLAGTPQMFITCFNPDKHIHIHGIRSIRLYRNYKNKQQIAMLQIKKSSFSYV